MKNTAKLLIVLIILTLLLPTLASCSENMPLWMLGEKTRAGVILDKIDTILLESSSYTLSAETKVYGMSAISPIVYTSTTSERAMNKNSKRATLISEMSYSVDYDIDEYDYSMTHVEGYTEGHMFRSVETGSFKSKFKSIVTPAEINIYNEEKYTDTRIPRSTLRSTKAEDGSWVVTITELDEESVNRMSMDVISMTPGYYVKSASIIVTVKEDFSSWTSEAVYVFEAIPDYEFPDGFFYMPVVSSKLTYTSLGSTTVDDIDLDGYTLIDSVNIMNKVSNDLMNKTLEPHGRAYIDITHIISYKGTVMQGTETDDVEFGIRNGSFYHTGYHHINDRYYPISYMNGIRKENGVPTPSTDDAERRYVNMIFTLGGYNPLMVKSVKKSAGENGETVYTFDVFMTEAMAGQYSLEDYSFNEGSITVTVTLVNNEIDTVNTVIRCWKKGDTSGYILISKVNTEFAD